MRPDEIARLLPGIFQRSVVSRRPLVLQRPLAGSRAAPAAGAPAGNVLAALLGVMETLHAPSETTLAELQRYFLPDQTDERFVHFLAQWVDLAWLAAGEGYTRSFEPGDGAPAPAGTPALRLLIAQAAELSSQRGTRQGMLRFLRLATGLNGFEIEESTRQAYHILVSYPPKADPRLVAAIVDHLKPAYVTFELCERVTPAPSSQNSSGEDQ